MRAADEPAAFVNGVFFFVAQKCQTIMRQRCIARAYSDPASQNCVITASSERAR